MLRKAILIGLASILTPALSLAHPAPRPQPLPERAHGYLGVELRDDSTGEAYILTIQKGSPAHRAGLEMYDRIMEIEGRPIDDPAMALERIAACRPGSKVEVTVMRQEMWDDSGVMLRDVLQTVVVEFGYRRADMPETECDRLAQPRIRINGEEQERQTGIIEGVGEEFLQ